MLNLLTSNSSCLLNREKFAVNLRKEKRKEILASKRLKIDKSQHFNDKADILHTLCS